MPETMTTYGSEGLDALAAAIAGAKAGDPLAPVTVVPPTSYAGLWLRRELGRRSGIANARFMPLARLAEFAGVTHLPDRQSRPLTSPVAAEAVRSVLLREPGLFGPVAAHPDTALALVASFNELEELPGYEVDALAVSGRRAGELVRLYRAFRTATAAYYSRAGLFRAAGEAAAAGSPALRDIGQVVLHLPGSLSPSQRAFVDALGEAGVLRAISAITGDSTLDGTDEGTLPVATRVVTATDADEEVRTVVSLVLADLEAGVPADRIACYYSFEPMYRDLLVEQLRGAGVPHNAPGGQSLASTPPGRALSGLLTMAAEGILRREFIGWISSAPIRQGGRAVPVRSWSRLTRDAGVVGGSIESGWERPLRHHVEELRAWAAQASGESQEGRTRALESAAARAEDLLTFVRDLSANLQSPPETWRGWTDRARGLLLHYLDQRDPAVAEPGHAETVEAVLDAVAELGSLDELGAPGPVDVATFRAAVAQALDAPGPRDHPFGHGVFVAPLSLGVGIGMESAFVLGAVEGLLPGPVREDPLLSERDRAAAPSLGGSHRRLRELRRAYLAVLAGSVRSTLACAATNLRRGREQLPSRWLLETATHHEGSRIDSEDFGRLRDRPWLLRMPSMGARLGSPAMPLLDRSEYDTASLRTGEPPQALSDRRPGVPRGMAVLRERRSGRFSRFDGNVGRDGGLPVQGIVSPTRLEEWARCPFRHFLGNVLRVAEFEEPEEVRALSALDRGTIMHTVLERFHQERKDREAGPWTDEDRAGVLAIAGEECAKFEERGRTGRPALWNYERARILADLTDYLDDDAARSQELGTRFEAAEVSFGQRGGGLPPAVVETPFGRVEFRGQIDRVDRGPNGEYWVYDYKTGSSYGMQKLEKDPLDHGQRLQLPVYAEAVRRGFGVENVRAAYWLISSRGRSQLKEMPVGLSTREQLGRVVGRVVDGTAAGVFPPNPGHDQGNCTYCPYTSLCAADRVYAFERKLPDPAMVPYAALLEEGD